jgi:hypothetical protein
LGNAVARDVLSREPRLHVPATIKLKPDPTVDVLIDTSLWPFHASIGGYDGHQVLAGRLTLASSVRVLELLDMDRDVPLGQSQCELKRSQATGDWSSCGVTSKRLVVECSFQCSSADADVCRQAAAGVSALEVRTDDAVALSTEAGQPGAEVPQRKAVLTPGGEHVACARGTYKRGTCQGHLAALVTAVKSRRHQPDTLCDPRAWWPWPRRREGMADDTTVSNCGPVLWPIRLRTDKSTPNFFTSYAAALATAAWVLDLQPGPLQDVLHEMQHSGLSLFNPR